MNAKEIADLYLKQTDRWVIEGLRRFEGEISALNVWEELITDDPERAWPVFLEIVGQRRDDDTLYQVGRRLYLLLHRHWKEFHERAEALVREIPRFSRIVGPELFDPEYFQEKPLDVAELMHAHATMSAQTAKAHALRSIVQGGSARGLRLAIEIVHRGPLHGLTSFDTFGQLLEILRLNGPQLIDQVEAAARDSYLVRRALWQMVPGQRGTPESYAIRADVWKRVVAATAGTTDWTDDTDPQPEPKVLDEIDEELLTAWFEHERTFWAFGTMNDLVEEDPETAWPILLQMINSTEYGIHLATLAAGPLEDLLREHGSAFFDRIAAEARSNKKLREALCGVWISKSEIYPRYLELMRELASE